MNLCFFLSYLEDVEKKYFSNVHRVTNSIALALMVKGHGTKTVVLDGIVEKHSNTHNVFG